MNMLNYGWRKYLSDLMGLGPNFWLAQGNLGLQTCNDSGLFLMADALPPVSDEKFYDAGSTNKRSDAYLGLLCALLPEINPNGLSEALGSAQYSAWISWKAANPLPTGETYLDHFRRWGIQTGADPDILVRGELAIKTAQNTQLLQAFEAYTNPRGRQSFGNETLPKYTATHAAAEAALAGSSEMKIRFDSSAMIDSGGMMNELGPGLRAMSSGAGQMSFFYGAGGTPLERAGLGIGAENALGLLNPKASRQRVKITGRIGSYATLASSPGSWYTSAEVERAYSGKNNPAIWNKGAAAGSWESFFDRKSGSLARYVSQLVLISDYELEVKIYGRYTKDDFNRVRSLAIAGAWPLFSSTEPPTQNIDYQLNPDVSIDVVNTLPPGKIQIWGVTVRQAP
jgi:hypothetical protein